MKLLNSRYEALCAQHGLSLRIDAVVDENVPRHTFTEADGIATLFLNLSRIQDYGLYLPCAVRIVLLPRLELKTGRLLLRRFRPGDAAACFAFLSDEKDAFMDCGKPFNFMDEEYAQRMELFAQREGQYAVTLRSHRSMSIPFMPSALWNPRCLASGPPWQRKQRLLKQPERTKPQ